MQKWKQNNTKCLCQ